MLDDKAIADLKAKHGDDLAAIPSDAGTLVFRKPTRQQYDRWFDKRNDKPTEAARELAQSCLVYPTRDDMIKALDDTPALLMGKGGILDMVTELAGLGGDQGGKKL